MTTVAELIPIVIVRNGQEQSAHHLNRGDRIAFREFDTDRRCYVFHVVTEGIPSSPEVEAAEGPHCDFGGSGA